MERQTQQRTAIWGYIKEKARPLSPQEMLEGARNTVPQLGMATVYRTIKCLRSEGKLVSVSIPGEPSRYEMAGLKHHHHFYCRKCGKVFELDGCLLRDDAQVPDGFAIEDHEVTLFGQCPRCHA